MSTDPSEADPSIEVEAPEPDPAAADPTASAEATAPGDPAAEPPGDPYADPAAQDWLTTASAVPTDTPTTEPTSVEDVFVCLPPARITRKFATELGLALLRGTPILLVLPPGLPAPRALLRAADQTLVVDLTTDDGRLDAEDTLRALRRARRARA